MALLGSSLGSEELMLVVSLLVGGPLFP